MFPSSTNHRKEVKTASKRYVTACTRVLQAAEIIYPEISNILKLSANAKADRVNDLEGDRQCQLKETCEDVVA
jgi:hypothetical protein